MSTRAPLATRSPAEINFIHETISDSFSSGPGSTPEKPVKGDNLDRVVSLISRKKVNAQDFPPLKIFYLSNRDGTVEHCFSLSNRRLYVFKKANVPQINVQLATFDEIVSSLWKMTSTSGGANYPKQTKQEPKKNARPGSDTVLGAFRNMIETQLYLLGANAKHASAASLTQTSEDALDILLSREKMIFELTSQEASPSIHHDGDMLQLVCAPVDIRQDKIQYYSGGLHRSYSQSSLSSDSPRSASPVSSDESVSNVDSGAQVGAGAGASITSAATSAKGSHKYPKKKARRTCTRAQAPIVHALLTSRELESAQKFATAVRSTSPVLSLPRGVDKENEDTNVIPPASSLGKQDELDVAPTGSAVLFSAVRVDSGDGSAVSAKVDFARAHAEGCNGAEVSDSIEGSVKLPSRSTSPLAG